MEMGILILGEPQVDPGDLILRLPLFPFCAVPPVWQDIHECHLPPGPHPAQARGCGRRRWVQVALLGLWKSLGWSSVGVGRVAHHSCPQTSSSSKGGDDPTIHDGGIHPMWGWEGFWPCREKGGQVSSRVSFIPPFLLWHSQYIHSGSQWSLLWMGQADGVSLKGPYLPAFYESAILWC